MPCSPPPPSGRGKTDAPTQRLGSPRGGASTRMTRIPSCARRMVRKGSAMACSSESTVSERKRSVGSSPMGILLNRPFLGQVDQDAKGVVRVDKGFTPGEAFEADARGIGVAVGHAATTTLELLQREVEIVHFERDVVDSRPAMGLKILGDRAILTRRLQELHPALANHERPIADAHVLDVFFRLEPGSEPGLKEVLRVVQVGHGERHAFETSDIAHGRDPDGGMERRVSRMPFKAARKRSVCSRLPTLTRIASGKPKSRIGRTITPD